MDFAVGLLSSTVEGYDAIWVVVDRLTKSAHFILIKITFSVERLAQIYIANIVRLHGVLFSIISDRDALLPHNFGDVYKRRLGLNLNSVLLFIFRLTVNLREPSKH